MASLMDKYLHYTIEELALDHAFIQYIRQPDDADSLAWNAWIAQHPEQQSKVEEASKIVSNFKIKDHATSEEMASAQSRVWKQIKPHLDKQPSKGRVISLNKLAPWIAVAAVGLLLIIFRFGTGGSQSYETTVAQIQAINLPDQSVATINAESTLTVGDDWNNNREVFLKGEGFFEVEKGSSFVVHTAYGEVTVLGTSFNVIARDGILSVQCETGKVQVTGADQETILAPNQSVTIADGTHLRSAIDLNRSAWKKGTYQYKDAKLEQVIRDMERQFDIDINVDKRHLRDRYTGRFTTADLEKALSEVFWPMSLKYEKEGREINVH